LQPTISYSKKINDAHNISALAVYTQSDYLSDTNGSLKASLPSRTQSVSGRLTYGYKSRYFAEVNAGYSGSQVFAPKQRWALFPALGFGWTISEEAFFEPVKQVVSYLKVRYSDGKVGTDGSVARFQYISTPAYPSVSYAYGDTYQYSHGGATEGTIGISGLTWETVRKQNVGVDFNLFDQIMVNVDVFKDYRSDILVKRNSLPVGVLGLSATPYGNVGEVETKGFEVHMDYRKTINKVDINLSGNLMYHRVNVIEDEDAAVPYSYMETQGMGLDDIYKYVSAGLYRDYDDIATSPIQSSLSPNYAIAPGDIKYKDLNGDGKVDVNDKTFVGWRQPRLYYSINGDISYNNFALKITLQGKGKMFRDLGQGTRIPFNQDYFRGNILVNDIGDRWIPESYSGDASTENPNATFPRLSRTPNSNNSVESSFWEKEAGYLKVQELSLAYSVPKDVATKLKMKSCRLYLTGQNLYTFSKFKYWDPEQTGAFAYPTQRLYSLTVELGF
jgi:TonB-linked SusC/RagA family outer membrane protein